jgi:hypothetical protein
MFGVFAMSADLSRAAVMASDAAAAGSRYRRVYSPPPAASRANTPGSVAATIDRPPGYVYPLYRPWYAQPYSSYYYHRPWYAYPPSDRVPRPYYGLLLVPYDPFWFYTPSPVPQSPGLDPYCF